MATNRKKSVSSIKWWTSFGDLSRTFCKGIVKPRCVEWFSQLVFSVYSSSYVEQHFVWCMNWTKKMPRPRNNPLNHAGPSDW